MARVPRTSLPDGYFHVYSRAVDAAKSLFPDDDDREVFVGLLWRTARRHAWTCHAFCLMETHYHLVLETGRANLSSEFIASTGSTQTGFNQKHGRFGHVFADRFSTRVIESEDYLFDACAYVLLNPVRARVSSGVQDWPWSYSRFGRELS